MRGNTFAAGSLLGPYEIRSLLGAGGMGEVYRARDTRLRRDVAVKVLPLGFGSDPELVKRFDREARAVSQLNHPNIVAIYDVGSDRGYEYVVMELLEGETLGTRLFSGALTARKTLDYAIQIGRGLAAAHDKHIIHRDLKPENIFILDDGRIKILDFGLARQLPGVSDRDVTAAASRLTRPGVVMGTVAYMSPEQVRGLPTDHRSDLFSFGVVLYEMITGKNPFEGASDVETMSAILSAEPVDLAELVPTVPPILRRVVNHCLEKKPEARFQSAHDLIFDLENCSEMAFGVSVSSAVRIPQPPSRRRFWAIAAAGVVAALTLTGATMFLRTPEEAARPTFRRMTFRRGMLQSARFTSDGRTIVYAASWEGKPLRLYLLRTERPESQELALPNADLLAISPTGEMAIGLNGRVLDFGGGGTLAQMPVLGGTPREIMQRVSLADWSPDGRLAIWRYTEKGGQLEFPIGRVLLTSSGRALALRFSPKGDQIALHVLGSGSTGDLMLVGTDGSKKTLASDVISAPGLAWTPDGKELWYAAAPTGEASAAPALFAVRIDDGEQRLVTRMPGWLWLHDISHDGQILMTYNSWESGIILPSLGSRQERDISWLDWSKLADISADGKFVLLTESREGVANTNTVYLRGTDGSPAVSLGEGIALGLDPTNAWALAFRNGAGDKSPRHIALLPTGAGTTERLRNALDCTWAGWLPDGRIIMAVRTAAGPRMYVQARGGAEPQALTPAGMAIGTVDAEGGGAGIKPVSPDGKWVLVFDRMGAGWLYPLAGGEPRAVPGVIAGDQPAGWSADGERLYVYQPQEVPLKVHEIRIATGERKLLHDINVGNLAGIYKMGPLLLTPDGQSFAYGYIRTLSTLYAAEGLH